MQVARLLATVLVAAAGGGARGAIPASPAPAPARRYPVSKVVKLLEGMKADLEKQADEDEEIYDKMACWCMTNEKEKTKAVSDADARLTQLQATVEENIAMGARYEVEIDGLKKEAAEEKAALATATALREKQAAEFVKDEKDMVEAIKALDAAIKVLAKHHTKPDATLIAQAVKTVRAQLEKHQDILEAVITPHQKRLLLGLTQQREPDYFAASPTFKQAYAPQSGQVFGILKQMKESFESNLSDSQKEEIANQKAFEDLKGAKEAEIDVTETAIDEKTQGLADAKETVAQSKEDITDTTASMNSDKKFLMDLKDRCSMTDKDWEERKAARSEEITAISKALEILTTDEARETFNKAFNMVQLQSRTGDDRRRAEAAAMLTSVASRTGSPRLSALSSMVKLDAFTKVKKAIDDMVEQLLKEKADEIEQRDNCINDLNQNTLKTERKTRDKADTETTLATLKTKKEALNSTIATLKEEVVDLKEQQKVATEERQAAKTAFEADIANQHATQGLLQEAITVLREAYASKEAAIAGPNAAKAGIGEGVLLQQQRGAAPVWGGSFDYTGRGDKPPPGLDPYSRHSGAAGVIAALEQIKTDSELIEKEMIKADHDALMAHETFIGETNLAIKAKEEGIVNKSEDLAKTEQGIQAKESELSDLTAELDNLADTKNAFHQSCDFILKNFEVRQAARDEEVDALRQAKAILSGMQLDKAAE